MDQTQMANCLVFLDRAQLTGAEAEALVSIKLALRQPVPDSDLKKSEPVEVKKIVPETVKKGDDSSD
jgi:hypothetical protein